LRIGASILLFLFLLHTGLLVAAAQQGHVTLKVRADPCITVSAFDQTALAPLRGERDGELWTFKVAKGHSVEISARTDGTCKVTGILEVARNLLTPSDKAFWYATYDADFEVRIEKPSLYVTVVGEPRECLSKISTEPKAGVKIVDGTAKVGPFYRDSSVVLSVAPAEKCEVAGMVVVGTSGSYRASSISLWMTRDMEVRVTFRVIGAEEGRKETETTIILPPPQRPSFSLPSIPPELLLVSALVIGAGLGSYAAARALKERRERRALEVKGAPSLLRYWIHRGRVTSVVLGLLSSKSATENYSINELLKAAERGTLHFDALNLYRKGTPLLASPPFDTINFDPVLPLHVAAHLVAAGLVPATFENRGRLRTELLPRWARMLKEGRYDRAVEEALEFVRSLRRDPTEALYSEKLREVEAERHPFVQDLIDAALEELGEVVPPVSEFERVERPAEREEEAREPHKDREAEVEGIEEPATPEPPRPTPAVPVAAREEREEVELRGPKDLYELVKGGEASLKGTVPAVIVGGAALMAAFNDDAETLRTLTEAVRTSALRVTPVDLDTDAVYFPAERGALEEAVVRLTAEEHLACLVADAVGGTPVHAKPNASPVQGAVMVDGGVDEDILSLAKTARERGLPLRVATYSRERALFLASRLGIKAIGIRGLPEVGAALLLPTVGAVEPRLFRALVGFSLLVPDFKARLLPPITKENIDDAASPSCHRVKGLIQITRALERIAAGKQQKIVEKGLRGEMGELGNQAAAILELRRLDPAREELTEVEVMEPPTSGQVEEQEPVQEPVIGEPPMEVAPDPDIILAHIAKGNRIRADVTPQVVGAMALKAEEVAFRGLISRILSGEISVHEDELPEGIYYPDEGTSALVSGIVDEEHMACVVARALGRGFEADMGGKPSGKRVATYSEERAFELSSALGLPAFRIEYLPQTLAYRVLTSSGEKTGPTELKIGVGLSLLFEGLPDALSAGSLMEALAAVSPCGRHRVPKDLLRGLMSVDLVRLVSMERPMAVEEIRTSTGLREGEAERLFELLTGPFKEGSLKPVAVSVEEVRRPRGIMELAGEALRAAAEDDGLSLSRMLDEVARSDVEDDRPSAPAIYYPEGDPWILNQIAVHAGSDHLACLVASSLSVDSMIDKGASPEEVASALRSGRPVVTKSRERARELASSVGAEAVGVDVVLAAAASVLAYWSSAKLHPIQELFLALTSASLFYPELPERLPKVDRRDLQNSLAVALISMRPCHKPDDELERAFKAALPLAATSAPYAVVREEVGELAQLIYLRPLSTPRPAAEAAGSEEEVLEEVEGEVEVRVVNDWLKFRLHPDGYCEAEIEGEKAPQRVAVQLGDGDRREAPVRFPVKSTAMKVYRIDEGERIDLKGDSVLLIAKLGHGIKRRREYANRLLELLEEIRGKVIVVGFLDRELVEALEGKGIEVVGVHDVIWEQAEKGARRLLGGEADYRVLRALTILLTLYPQMARARGRTRGEVAEEAFRILSDLLRYTDDDGYLFLADAVRVLIGERKIPGVPPRMRKVAETLGIR
jgi:hypothetical protein